MATSLISRFCIRHTLVNVSEWTETAAVHTTFWQFCSVDRIANLTAATALFESEPHISFTRYAGLLVRCKNMARLKARTLAAEAPSEAVLAVRSRWNPSFGGTFHPQFEAGGSTLCITADADVFLYADALECMSQRRLPSTGDDADRLEPPRFISPSSHPHTSTETLKGVGQLWQDSCKRSLPSSKARCTLFGLFGAVQAHASKLWVALQFTICCSVVAAIGVFIPHLSAPPPSSLLRQRTGLRMLAPGRP